VLEAPFAFLRCSWPRAAQSDGAAWTSEPEWSAPWMPSAPRPSWQWLNGEFCWTIDWAEFFSGGIRTRRGYPGEMRGFHVIFELSIVRDGELVFWDDDGCVVRRNGHVIHADRRAHRLRRHCLPVQAGDRLKIAQWQRRGGWLWGARMQRPGGKPDAEPADLLTSHLPRVASRLRCPDGPALKIFSHGRSPLRMAVAVYSCILNGYSPAGVYLFGEHQWTPHTRQLITRLLPFAIIVPTADVLRHLRSLGQPALTERAIRHWYVMKACVSLLCAPAECCCMDDDVFVLGPVDDALAAFSTHDLVYAPDMDHGDGYRATWSHLIGEENPLSTARFNAGLYWVRVKASASSVAAVAAQAPPTAPHYWEQGLIAATYARAPNLQLPSSRYFYPAFDGLPGGVHGYDYAANPCQFASIHFGALRKKPTDADTAVLLADILAERTPETTA